MTDCRKEVWGLEDEFHASAPQQWVAGGPGHPLGGGQDCPHQVGLVANHFSENGSHHLVGLVMTGTQLA